MPRTDICGFFWDDTPAPKPPKKEKPKCVPPEPTWLLPTYLPNLDKARAFKPELFTDPELVIAAQNKERLVWDVECYPNYFLIALRSVDSGKSLFFEMDKYSEMDLQKLAWVLHSFLLVDFNGNNYDVPIAALALKGKLTSELHSATDQIINQGIKPYMVLRKQKTKGLRLNHIDLIDLVALRPSLKLLAGRLHAPQLQDLPFPPGTLLSEEQVDIVRWYCFNDLTNTELLYKELLPEINLRERLGHRYGMDLRSKSDPQIAEAIIVSEILKGTGERYVSKPKIDLSKKYKYRIPSFLNYQSSTLQWVLSQVETSWFGVAENGKLQIPNELKKLKIPISGSVYKLGIGGLHSVEKSKAHLADDETLLCDRDVASYYPRIILNSLLAPTHLGARFLRVYNGIVIERLAAKEAGNDATAADGLKIVINASFGKFGSKYSALHSPDLLIQVTITGQLALLLLIERMELVGIPVVSANTDGIIVKCPKIRQSEMDAIVRTWEKDTGFETEAVFYKGVFSRDVNNYFAVKEDLSCKIKGVYSERGSSRNSILAKNPTSIVCSDAVKEYLAHGTAIEQTIRTCFDFRRFVSVRKVVGGAVKNGEYLGKVVRWYYAKNEEGAIIYAKTGNKVPRSDGARPCMEMPPSFPEDLDFEWYETEANRILQDIGAVDKTNSDEEDDDDEEDEDDELAA